MIFIHNSVTNSVTLIWHYDGPNFFQGAPPNFNVCSQNLLPKIVHAIIPALHLPVSIPRALYNVL